MSVYLHDIPLPEAQNRLQLALQEAGLWGLLGVESIPLDEQACGRVLAEAVWARISSPHYHASAMDGFAVRSAETIGAQPASPVELTCGEPASASQAAYVDTGDPLPAWADAVIPIENVDALDESGRLTDHIRRPAIIRIRSSVTPWGYVRTLGEDIIATQLVLPAGHRLRPVDLGAVAASGNSSVQVARRPKVAILPTGSELVEIGRQPQAGDIIEYNSMVLAAQVNAWGGQAARLPIVPDNLDLIQAKVKQAAGLYDLILVNAGSSAGAEDFTAQVVENLGRVLVHGVAVRPGHPVIMGMLELSDRPTPIIGVPGYPVSAALTGEIFIQPLIERWLGCQSLARTTLQATLTRKITSPAGDDDFIRVAVGQVGNRYLAAPLARGAGVITSLVRADGLAHLPPGIQGLPAGAPITVSLYRSIDEIRHTLLIIGSHDICIDVMAQYIAKHNRFISSANVGSQGGLLALQRGEAHLAGSHLLDPLTGEYNISYLPQYLGNIPARLVGFVYRQQGLIIPKGNPKGIQDLNDLKRPDISFVNRQRGAGTRVFLDYQLERLGIAQKTIRGYNQEEYTHLAVAAAVASGRADCGLGIAAAAQALMLDFIPLAQERYDLVIPQEYAESELLAPLFDLLQQDYFRSAVSKLPGYDSSPMGQLIFDYRPQ